jgi:hypothetical protein
LLLRLKVEIWWVSEEIEASLLKEGRPLSFFPEILALCDLGLWDPSSDGEPGMMVLRSAGESICSGSSCMVTAKKKKD